MEWGRDARNRKTFLQEMSVKQMKIRRIFKIVQLIILVFSLPAKLNASQVIDRMYLAGVNVSYHDRLGHLFFSDGSEQKIARPEIPSIGLVIGKRFALPWKTRLQIPFFLDYGAVNEDTENSFDGIKKTSLFHAGMIPTWQLPLRLSSESAFYLSVGGGLHLVRFIETDIDEIVNYSTCSSISFMGGAGFEMMTTKKRAITVQYTLRYGKPVYYKYMKDLFPYKSITYKETFLTHSIQFIVMVYRGMRPL